MENYNLGPNEVVLYKGDVKLKDTSGSTELILTNINLVFINKIKKLFSKEEFLFYCRLHGSQREAQKLLH